MAYSSGLVISLCLFCILSALAKRELNVVRKGNTEFILDSIETRSDHEFVEYFEKVPDSKVLYTYRVVKLTSAFTINIVIKALKSLRIMYKVENLKGCEFLNNPWIYKLFGEAYKNLVVNGSYLKCPIKPKIYFLKAMGVMYMIPRVNLPGRFQLTMHLKTPESRKPFVMEMVLKYTIVRIK
ncbi:uncharacterized protein LOC108106214 [Drosophila eugracilis]|uniref:uncharacterized protein LOC108106214 n=1 Tax=Drosophila eugracilis TaxID=29029 RepID=UPI0007E821C7|nr:uncharacterized protein LOC108106214 [Drosophila eugracilis]